jgi:hypothetical protein
MALCLYALSINCAADSFSDRAEATRIYAYSPPRVHVFRGDPASCSAVRRIMPGGLRRTDINFSQVSCQSALYFQAPTIPRAPTGARYLRNCISTSPSLHLFWYGSKIPLTAASRFPCSQTGNSCIFFVENPVVLNRDFLSHFYSCSPRHFVSTRRNCEELGCSDTVAPVP